jgi:putative FmdB family regulatory protein
MPIYEYRCRSCGAEKEVLQKLSDPPLTQCPVCGKPEMVKLVSAAGFQLKGTGWYVTDFKHGSRPQKSANPEDGKAGKSDAADAAKSESLKSDSTKSDAAKSESAKSDSAKSEASGGASAKGTGPTSGR